MKKNIGFQQPPGRHNHPFFIGTRTSALNFLARGEGTRFELTIPIGSMHGIFTYIYHKHHPNVGKQTRHVSHGIGELPAVDVCIRRNPVVFSDDD